jgi:hypothetical protein
MLFSAPSVEPDHPSAVRPVGSPPPLLARRMGVWTSVAFESTDQLAERCVKLMSRRCIDLVELRQYVPK